MSEVDSNYLFFHMMYEYSFLLYKYTESQTFDVKFVGRLLILPAASQSRLPDSAFMVE